MKKRYRYNDGQWEDSELALGLPPCDHDWVPINGLDDFLQVLCLGDTTMVYSSRCAICRLSRTETCYGDIRNDDDVDTVVYEDGIPQAPQKMHNPP